MEQNYEEGKLRSGSMRPQDGYDNQDAWRREYFIMAVLRLCAAVFLAALLHTTMFTVKQGMCK